MKYSKHIYIIGVILIVLVLAGVAYMNLRNGQNPEQQESQRIAQLEQDDKYTVALQDLKKIKAETIQPDAKVLYYIRLGLAWKTVGEISRDNQDFNFSIAAYQKAVEFSENKNIIPIINIGAIYEIMGDYAQAEKYYLQARDVNTVEYEPYKRLVDLYTYNKINKDPKDVIVMLDAAIDSAFDQMPLLQLKAIYLKEKGMYEEALKIYEIMAQKNPQFKAAVDELRLKINVK